MIVRRLALKKHWDIFFILVYNIHTRPYENVGGAHKLCSIHLLHDQIQSMSGVADNLKQYIVLSSKLKFLHQENLIHYDYMGCDKV